MSIASTVVVEPVRSRRNFEALVDLPPRVPRDRPMVPPLREFERHLFDRGHRFRGNLSPTALLDGMLMGKENPFYEHGDLELFLAKDRSGGAERPIARIVAIHNRLHNEHNQDRVGFFGFYQCVDGGEAGRDATRALVEAASA